MKKLLFLFTVFAATGCFGTDIYLCGDSTICHYSGRYAPKAGWGMKLKSFCVQGVEVINLGAPGATTQSIRMTHKLWDKLINKIKPGDFVVIQFGHNDQKPNNPKKPNHVHCGVNDLYPANLAAFIHEVKAKKAFPVLATPICRRIYKDGKFFDPTKPTLREYSDAAMAIAKKENIPVVDMNGLTTEMIVNAGEEGSKKFYMILKPGEFPNYPKGSNDLTHLNTNGAEIFASLFVEDAKKQKLPIAKLFK